ncbi:MAG: GrpB family protein [Janthinobacterium lividum]
MDEVIISDYNPDWPQQFAEIAGRVRHAFADGPLIAVEHIGSTSIAGLAAKPIIDIDVIVPSETDVPDAIARLATVGYVHQGDNGIPGREAFQSPPGSPKHHLYLCLCDGLEYHRHIAFRDYLREHFEAAEHYEALKRDLAARFRNDRVAYNDGKTTYIEAVVEKAREQQRG